MVWLEFRQRFIPDFYKTYGRLPTEREIADAETSFQQYTRSHFPASEAEIHPEKSQQARQDNISN